MLKVEVKGRVVATFQIFKNCLLYLSSFNFLFFYSFLLFCFQEGSDHDEGEDADAEEDEYDLAGDETSEDSDSEELEDKDNYGQLQLFLHSEAK